MIDAQFQKTRWSQCRRSARWAGCVGMVAAVISDASAVFAQAGAPPRLMTNQSYIEEVTRPTELAIDDPMAVFA